MGEIELARAFPSFFSKYKQVGIWAVVHGVHNAAQLGLGQKYVPIDQYLLVVHNKSK